MKNTTDGTGKVFSAGEMKTLFWQTGAAQLAVSALFLTALYLDGNRPFLWGGLYCIAICLIFACSFKLADRRINRVMEYVDNCITDMINGNFSKDDSTYFSQNEDSLLGKFQSQSGRLYEILKAGEEKEKEFRSQLSGLVADLVHQMNTPLTNIRMYCDFLSMPELEENNRQKFLKNIAKQTEKLGWFGEGFDKAARLETDIMVLTPCLQPLLPIVLEAIGQAAPKAEKQGKEICLEGGRDILVYVDARWTAEAVFNLVDNAIKYGAAGEKIIVRLHRYELYACTEVCSEGNRIPETERTQVFKRFYRGKTAALVREGVGLGLFLTRNIIGKQGGYVSVTDYGEQGNCFRIFMRTGA